MSWVYLAAAILFEVAGTTCMKLSDGFANRLPTVLVFVCYGISFVLLIWTLKRIEVSTAYAIWSGLGTVLVTVIGVYWFRESLDWLKAGSIGLIILGVVGLHLGSRLTAG